MYKMGWILTLCIDFTITFIYFPGGGGDTPTFHTFIKMYSAERRVCKVKNKIPFYKIIECTAHALRPRASSYNWKFQNWKLQWFDSVNSLRFVLSWNQSLRIVQIVYQWESDNHRPGVEYCSQMSVKNCGIFEKIIAAFSDENMADVLPLKP